MGCGVVVFFLVFFFGRGEKFGNLPNSAFLLSKKPLYLCKCALCPLAYCLNSIVDFLWEAHRGLGA